MRSGLPLYKTNEACGVKNAATRKYFTQCHLWYFPPPEKMEMLASYANSNGQSTDKPYFTLDGTSPLTAKQWSRMRAKWNHTHGITNVWQEPAVRGKERIIKKGMKSLHANQKPLNLMGQIISASTDYGDVVWEPFGGLCSAAVASLKLGRACYASEVIPEYFDAASERIKETYQELPYYERKRNS
jgi:site-specific DNA-methyltransferase (adenine-specific)